MYSRVLCVHRQTHVSGVCKKTTSPTGGQFRLWLGLELELIGGSADWTGGLFYIRPMCLCTGPAVRIALFLIHLSRIIVARYNAVYNDGYNHKPPRNYSSLH